MPRVATRDVLVSLPVGVVVAAVLLYSRTTATPFSARRRAEPDGRWLSAAARVRVREILAAEPVADDVAKAGRAAELAADGRAAERPPVASAADDKDGGAGEGPPLSPRAGCPRVLVLDATGWAFGFGHRFLMLLIAVDIASKLGAQLALDDDLWEESGGAGADNFGFSASYGWTWGVFPFQKASAVPLCARLPQRDAAVARADRERARSVSHDLLRPRECGGCERIQVGLHHSCDGGWCVKDFAGVFDRAAPLLRRLSPGVRALWSPPPRLTEPVRVLWHVRTGDETTRLERGPVMRLKATIDAKCATRGVQHELVTYNYTSLYEAYPWLQDAAFGSDPWPLRTDRPLRGLYRGGLKADGAAGGSDTLEALTRMVRAPILVSTGSSFPLAAAALAEPGRQIHLYGPPKEANWALGKAIGFSRGDGSGAPLHNVRSSAAWRTYYLRTNTVPLEVTGSVVASYAPKLDAMLEALDRHGRFEPELAAQSFEAWI